METHAKTGGVIPEIAARQQLTYMIPVLEQALEEANVSFDTIDAVATPMAQDSLVRFLVGVETARRLQ